MFSDRGSSRPALSLPAGTGQFTRSHPGFQKLSYGRGILGFATHIAAGAIHFLIGLIVSILSWIELGTTETLPLED